MTDLERDWQLPAGAVGILTSAVQLGFVAGTLVFALLMPACALAGAALNGLMLAAGGAFGALVLLRFAVGFALRAVRGPWMLRPLLRGLPAAGPVPAPRASR